MIEVKLFTEEGHLVTSQHIPVFKEWPEVLVWGDRHFVLREDGRYTEANFVIHLPIV